MLHEEQERGEERGGLKGPEALPAAFLQLSAGLVEKLL